MKFQSLSRYGCLLLNLHCQSSGIIKNERSCVCVCSKTLCIWFIQWITDVILICLENLLVLCLSVSVCNPTPPHPHPNPNPHPPNREMDQSILVLYVFIIYIYNLRDLNCIFKHCIVFLIIPLLYVVSPALFSTFRLFIYQITRVFIILGVIIWSDCILIRYNCLSMSFISYDWAGIYDTCI